MAGRGNLRHGLRHTRLYGIYQHMKQRCYNPNNKDYHCYGERGIIVCDEWLNDFQAFYDWAMSNGYQENLTLDRMNVNGNYEPTNCRWATSKEQANNTRANHYITFEGKTHTMSEWAKIMRISYSTLRYRLNVLHWTIERALTTEVKS